MTKCVNVCRLDDNKICVGCGRHIDEITRAGNRALRIRWLLRIYRVEMEYQYNELNRDANRDPAMGRWDKIYEIGPAELRQRVINYCTDSVRRRQGVPYDEPYET
jgi:hypothetical protein